MSYLRTYVHVKLLLLVRSYQPVAFTCLSWFNLLKASLLRYSAAVLTLAIYDRTRSVESVESKMFFQIFQSSLCRPTHPFNLSTNPCLRHERLKYSTKFGKKALKAL